MTGLAGQWVAGSSTLCSAWLVSQKSGAADVEDFGIETELLLPVVVLADSENHGSHEDYAQHVQPADDAEADVTDCPHGGRVHNCSGVEQLQGMLETGQSLR